MDMVDHEDKILIILDNSDLVILDKESGSQETIELSLTETPTCMNKVGDNILIGATNGVVYCSKLTNMVEPIELPKPPYLGEGSSDKPEKIEYPDARFIKVSPKKISVLFNDKTMVFYDILSLDNIVISTVKRSHAGPVYAIDSYPHTGDSFKFCFLTGSTDKTLRRWIISADKKYFFCKMEQDSMGLLCDDFDHLKTKNNGVEIDDLGKIRSLKISPHNSLNHIACGDSSGYIWTFDSVTMKLINIYEVHQNEILGLDYSPYEEDEAKRSLLLATASKDHTVKLFDSKNDYQELRNIEDHKSAVVGVRFVQDPTDSDIKVVSAESKGVVSVRSVDDELNLTVPVAREIKDSKIFSMTTSDTSILLGLDRKVQIGQLRNNNTFVLKKSALAQPSRSKEFIKLDADNIGLYAVASSKKKRDIHFIELCSGNVIQSFTFGEIITAAKFSPNYKFLITSTASGCVIIIKTPNNLEREIMFRSNQKTLRITETPKANLKSQNSDGFSDTMDAASPVETSETTRKAWYEKDQEKPALDFSRDTLPDWAKSTMGLGEDMDEAEFIYQPKSDSKLKLQTTVSGDEDENEEDSKSDFLYTTKTDGGISEHLHESDEEKDAFNFEQSRVRKTSNLSEIMARPSRIGNMIRQSFHTRDSAYVTNSDRTSLEVNVHKSSDLKEITEKSSKKEETTKKTLKDVKKEDIRASIINNKAVTKSKPHINRQIALNKPIIEKIDSLIRGKTEITNTGSKIGTKKSMIYLKFIDILVAVIIRSQTKEDDEKDAHLNFDTLVNDNRENHNNFRHNSTKQAIQQIVSSEKR